MTQERLIEEEQQALNASKAMQTYFDHFRKDCFEAYTIAQKARARGYDPEEEVGVTLAQTLAERVIGLISVIAPQIKNAGIEKRIEQLEKEHGVLDWRVALIIALEIAQQKYCAFEDEMEAITTGVRVGFAYITLGVVSAPLEGLTSIELKERLDKRGKYFCLNFSGPIRNAGGTAAAVSVLIADYVRTQLGYDVYDPTEKEMHRCPAELADYHNYITNLQYFPSEEESLFMMQHMPVEISGDPSERYDVGNITLRDLPRVPTNRLRSGYCLIHSSCIPLKAPKLWKHLSKWGDALGLSHWSFLKKFLALQKKMKAKGLKTTNEKITPDYTYIKDLVAGRPVLGYPLRQGGFRLRYGRSRASGYSGQAIHPCTMHVLNNYIASATQLKVERPGKAAAFMPCDTIDGPIVKLDDGSVVYLQEEIEAKAVKDRVKEILYLGDVLVNYGDFFDRNHALIPAGYCPEWWAQELERTGTVQQISARTGLPEERITAFLTTPLHTTPTAAEALTLTKKTHTPLHSAWTPFLSSITVEQLRELKHNMVKETLELLGIPHTHDIQLTPEWKLILTALLEGELTGETPIDAVALRVRDKAGTFIGARMGRPEKAKMRKLTGSPHALFPVGEEGGRLRSIQEALVRRKITAEFPIRHCTSCDKSTIFARCERCDTKTEQRTQEVEYYGKKETKTSIRQEIPINEIFDMCLKKLQFTIYPDLIKGVRGTSNKSHIPEHLIKGILRAKHSITVNKDGTTRYDSSEIALTHFRPYEIDAPVARLKELGYTHDCQGKELERDDQILELKPQDLVLPCCPESPDEPCDAILMRTANYVDELLHRLYGMDAYYKIKHREDLLGQYVVGLAPHTSAGIVGRIIGFSKTQGFLAHPMYHAAMRRDCFVADTYIPLKKNGQWRMEKIGDVVEHLQPKKIVDAYGTLETEPEGYTTFGIKNGKIAEVPVKNFTKHTEMPIIELETKLGKRLKTTANHKHIVRRNGKEKVVRASDLVLGDVVKLPYNLPMHSKDIKEIDLFEKLKGKKWLMVRGLKKHVPLLSKKLQELNVPYKDAMNYSRRDSVPARFAEKIMKRHKISHNNIQLAAIRDTVVLPTIIEISDDFLACLGLYIAEGYARNQKGRSYQLYIAAEKNEIRSFIRKTFSKLGLKPSEKKTDRVTYSSRILYELFTNILRAGSSAYEKRIPSQFLSLPPKRMGKLLSGYLEGDGSVSKTDLRITFDTVSNGLMRDIEFVLGRMNVFVKFKESTRQPGPPLREFYEKKGKEVPSLTCTKGTIQSKFVKKMGTYVSFLSQHKKKTFMYILTKKKFRNLFCEYDRDFFYDTIVLLKAHKPEPSYCLNVENNTIIANGILTKQCDGDESCIILLMDVFLNFSPKFLPGTRGSTMDAPLVVTYLLNPAEVDDMAFHVDRVWKYPLELYEAGQQYKKPYDVKIELIGDVLGTAQQFEGMGFTHDTKNLNAGVLCSAYKLLPSMREKMEGQMDLAVKISACDTSDVARLIIEKHFLRDIKGNFRKFSQQEFRCVKCNEKFRRPPLIGRCTKCKGKIIFTISEGSVIKYLEPSLTLAEQYNVPPYLKQDLELLRRKIEDYFGKDKEKQTGLGEFS